MTRILHLSDLHLGDPFDWQFLDEAKGKMVSGDRRMQKAVLGETLRALEADKTLEKLDAVVISGDLANRAEEKGFDEFKDLAELITCHVEPEKVVVVPGNHDVPREHGPGDPDRYKEFLRVTRAAGFATPLLDGLDFDGSGTLTPEAAKHAHVVRGDDFVIVPLNSSHYCWGTEPLPAGVVESFLTVPEEEIIAATEELRRYDVARVSNAQMTAVEAFLGSHEPGFASRSDDERVRIGVLHHQLLPVSGREEFKSFESLTNLGAVREFLASLGTQVVLHGHKHESALYWDYVPDPESLSARPSRMLVSAASGKFTPGGRVVRLVEIGARRDARDVGVTDVLAARTRGGEIRHRPQQRARLWDGPMEAAVTESRVVRGLMSSDVYAKVQSIFDSVGPGKVLHYLVCEIADPRAADKLPVDYPPPDGVDDPQAWMTDLVEWWQLPDPQLIHGVEFNHGERIYRRWGDQVEKAADLLSARSSHDPSTTRAAILLLDPRTEASARKGEFPSFVLVQLQLVREGDDWRLDCTGYFRKQEMRYWWPINVAELAAVQGAVAAGVKIDDGHPRAGMLRTITAHAIAEDRLPVVAVPAVDRAVDQRPEDLWRMAYGLIEPEKVDDPTELRRTWRRYLLELEPAEDPSDETPPMSRRGLQTILRFVAAVDAKPTEVVKALENLVELYDLFRSPAGADPKTTSTAASKLLAKLNGELDALFVKDAL